MLQTTRISPFTCREGGNWTVRVVCTAADEEVEDDDVEEAEGGLAVGVGVRIFMAKRLFREKVSSKKPENTVEGILVRPRYLRRAKPFAENRIWQEHGPVKSNGPREDLLETRSKGSC